MERQIQQQKSQSGGPGEISPTLPAVEAGRDKKDDNSTTSTKRTGPTRLTGLKRWLLGKVKNFDPKKGWGFITGDDNKDYFVHQTGIQMNGFRKLGEGERVNFDIETQPNGKTKAINVSRL